jgi:hypothetical protein
MNVQKSQKNPAPEQQNPKQKPVQERPSHMNQGNQTFHPGQHKDEKSEEQGSGKDPARKAS